MQRMSLMRTIFAAIFTFVFCSTAHAQWRYRKVESAFDPDSHYVFVSTTYVLGLVCPEDKGDITFAIKVFFTLKKDYRLRHSENPDVELLVRVDDGEVENLAGTVTKDYGMITGVVAVIDSPTLLIGIRDAEKRIAVAYRNHEGNLRHEHSFPVQGSTRAMSQFIENCPTARRMIDAQTNYPSRLLNPTVED